MKNLAATLQSAVTRGLSGAGSRLPYEIGGRFPSERAARVAAVALGALAFLELVTFFFKGVFAVVMSRIWAIHGLFAVLFLLLVAGVVVVQDIRRGRFWFLLPVAVAVPLCFWNIGGFGALNTESLGELQHGLECLREPGWGYMGVLWYAYPSRMFLVNLVPTLLYGASPEACRLGFALPVFAGVLFFFAGLRRAFGAHPLAAPISALGAAATLTFPVVVWVTRTFETAISSFAIGLWACGALLLCAARPTLPAALAAAWTGGLLAAAFTPSLALAALLVLALGLWLARALHLRQRPVALLVGAMTCYVTVFTFVLTLVRGNPFHARPADWAQRFSMFGSAVRLVLSIDQIWYANVFTPAILVFPLIAAICFSLSGRGGVLPLLGILWCLPVVWACVNFQGKIAPQLPFALYRVIVIIPVLACILAITALRLSGGDAPGTRRLVRGLSLALAGGIVWSAVVAYRYFKVFEPNRPPDAAEQVIQRLIQRLPEVGLAAESEAVLLEKTGDYKFQGLPALSWYFLRGWIRPVQPEAPLWIYDEQHRRPGIIFVCPDSPMVDESPPGYIVKKLRFGDREDPSPTPEILGLVYLPARTAAGDGASPTPR